MKKTKILPLLGVVAAFGITLASCGPTPTTSSEAPTPAGSSEVTPPASSEEVTPPASSEETKDVITFAGKAIVEGEEVDCKLEADAGKFELNVGTIKKFTGTYVYLEGVGYEFTFDKTNAVVLTHYDDLLHAHVMEFNAKLGDAGNVDLVLTCVDEDFQFSAKNSWLHQAQFRGTSSINMKDANGEGEVKKQGVSLALDFNLDGTCVLSANRPAEFNGLEGTYTFVDNEFAITFQGKTTKSTYDFAAGRYNLPISLVATAEGGQVCNSVLHYDTKLNYGLHGLNDQTIIMGSPFQVNLTIDDHGNCLFDAFNVNPLGTSMGGMDLDRMFDKKGTYEYNPETEDYTFHTEDVKYKTDEKGNPIIDPETHAPMVDKIIPHTWTSTHNEDGVYTVHYVLSGMNGDFEYDLVGTDFDDNTLFEGNSTVMGGQIPVQIKASLTTLRDRKGDITERKALIRVISGYKDGHYNEDGSYTLGAFDKEGTFTYENNVVTVKIEGSEDMVLTFDEETGVYTLPCTIVGEDATITADLTLGLWN